MYLKDRKIDNLLIIPKHTAYGTLIWKKNFLREQFKS